MKKNNNCRHCNQDIEFDMSLCETCSLLKMKRHKAKQKLTYYEKKLESYKHKLDMLNDQLADRKDMYEDKDG